MNPVRHAYLDKLRRFWAVDDLTELKFNRVETLYGEDRDDDRFDELADERVKWLLGGLRLPAQARIVEIGCGIGAVIERVIAACPDATLWGTDISPTMIAEAKKRLGDSPRIHLEVTEGDGLGGIADRSVDFVICTGVFIHIVDIGVIRNYIGEACRVLKPGGSFRFNVRYWNPQLSFDNTLGGRMAKFLYQVGWYSSLKPRDLGKVRSADFNGLHFTLGEVETLIREAGLVSEQFILATGEESAASGYLRANCHRRGGSAARSDGP